MPQKCKVVNEDEGFDAADHSKQTRAEDFPGNVTHPVLSYYFDHSTCMYRRKPYGEAVCSEWHGYQRSIVQMRRIESMQTAAAVKSKQLTNLDAATQGEEINPMAPHFDMEPESSQITSSLPSCKPQPRPCVATNAVTSQPSPIFSLAAPNQAFGFRLPNTGQTTASDHSEVSSDTSHASSFFHSGNPASCASTVPTSWAGSVGSVCSSSQGVLGASQQWLSHGYSSRLKALACASQYGIEAPPRLSQVPSATAAHPPPQSSFSSSQQGQLISLIFFFHSHMCIPSPAIPSHQSDEPDEPVSPPPHCIGLWQTASFYTLLDGHQLGRSHSLSAVPSHQDGFGIKEPDIDENSPSDDERFAESVLRGI